MTGFFKNRKSVNVIIIGLLVGVYPLAIFLYTGTKKNLDSNEERLNKIQEFSDGVASSLGWSMEENVQHLKGQIEPLLLDNNIISLIVKNKNGSVIYQYNSKKYRESDGHGDRITVENDIKKSGIYLGKIEVTALDFYKQKKASQMSDLIVRGNLKNLWEYNLNALREKTESFSKDREIYTIKIVDASGHVIVDFSRKKSYKSELVYSSKDFIYNGRILGKAVVAIGDAVSDDSALKSFLKTYFVPFSVLYFIVSIVIIAKREIIVFREGRVSFPGRWNVSNDTQKKLEDIIEYIESNYDRNISREGLAAMVGMNPDNLGRYFKIFTGKRINDYINTLRIDNAAKQLEIESKNVLDIAFSVGYESMSSFYRAFTKIKKMTPSEYRESVTSGRHNK